ncbi:Butyryl-CoA dehydrogenase [Tenacibaculum sp. 190130A14a]|uniref:Acyl-CoA dehydrogenase n=1 Tax=Tenacibaculum polynesiense TaxID=3137857 RepID=A0ABM9PFY5_9FLAO
MSTEAITLNIGGSFLVKDESLDNFYTTELKSEESIMIQEAASQFLETEIAPNMEELESINGIDKTPELLKKCGELGFLSLEVSEEYDGVNLSLKDVLHFVESMSKGYSFGGALGVQTSIGIAPVLLYGSDFLKEHYISKMTDGTFISAFALTEPNAGSDANAGKTKATINNNGDYIINGQKAWISNAGIANMFIVFAKIEDDKNLSAFVVDKNFGGISFGPEEKKMGLSGWSTRQVFFENTIVPSTHLLGERNKGLKIALNTLNTGRIKLAASCLGIGKLALEHSVNYAIEREQFGKSILEFGAMKDKIAKMTSKIFTNEAIVYRVANAIDTNCEVLSKTMSFSEAKIEALKEFSIECAIAKVFGSEIQDFIVDESIQIYGGMGFSAESPVERLYRGARISRIFEGTNEINRLVIIKEFLKKGMKGEIDFFTPYTQLMSVLSEPIDSFSEDSIERYEQVVSNLRSLCVVTTGVCAQQYMTQLAEEQEIAMLISDMLITIYALESVVLRMKKLKEIGKFDNSIHNALLKTIGFDSFNSLENTIKNLVVSFDKEEDAEVILQAFAKYGQIPHSNVKEARREICAHIEEAKGIYNLSN